jgi:hypothetical protein
VGIIFVSFFFPDQMASVFDREREGGSKITASYINSNSLKKLFSTLRKSAVGRENTREKLNGVSFV